MNDLEHAGNMLTLAGHDLTALEGMRDAAMFTDGIFGFHAQQSVEKALKAWISALGGEYPPVHDIGELIEFLRDMGGAVEGLEEYADLNPFAVQFRYSIFDYGEEPLNRDEAINKVQALYDRVNGIIAKIF